MGWGGERRAFPMVGLLACGIARFLRKPRAAWRSWAEGRSEIGSCGCEGEVGMARRGWREAG